ncbi:MAG: septum formation protein Maf [Gammaproteobacteria bacterium]|nr:MAG: septum formation protein Maf [Pseudomonadota bacterium]PIE38904.1 MAG: septum formation protein Maf [Gammaproteobacteria bacterium]
MKKLILASASPRRVELLTRVGVPFEQYPVDVDESPTDGETNQELVERLALLKAKTARKTRLSGSDCNEQLYFLGSDTLGVLDNQLLVKPRDYDHEAEMLRSMSGRSHTILTSVALVGPDFEQVTVSRSEVFFRQIRNREIKRYWLSGEPQDKAGGYAVQGRGAIFVSHLIGSYSGVVGLPIMETAVLLEQAGFVLWADIDYE